MMDSSFSTTSINNRNTQSPKSCGSPKQIQRLQHKTLIDSSKNMKTNSTFVHIPIQTTIDIHSITNNSQIFTLHKHEQKRQKISIENNNKEKNLDEMNIKISKISTSKERTIINNNNMIYNNQKNSDQHYSCVNMNNSETSGFIYNQNGKKQIITFGKLLKGDKHHDMNIVGIGKLYDTTLGKSIDIIYKIHRFPSFNIQWEHSISCNIQHQLSSLKHFSQTIGIVNINLQSDKYSRCLAKFSNHQKNQQWIKSEVLIQKFVPGPSFTEKILETNSYRIFFSIIYQVLATLHYAQKKIQYTHYDLHISNIKVKPLKNENIFFLYDLIENENPILVPSYGNKAIIIDHEYSHCNNMDESSLDASLLMLNHGIDPTQFDPSLDVIRFMFSSIGYYKKQYQGTLLENIFNHMYRYLHEQNHQDCFKNDGIMQSKSTFSIDFFIQHFIQNYQNSYEQDKISYWIKQCVQLISHRIHLPLTQKVESSESIYFENVINDLLELNATYYQRRRILFEIVKDTPLEELLLIMKQFNIKFQKSSIEQWFEKILCHINQCLPYLETVLYWSSIENQQRRQKQDPHRFTPMAIFHLISQHYRPYFTFTNETIIYWMKKYKQEKVSFQYFDEKMLNNFNDFYNNSNLLEIAKYLKNILNSL